MGKAPDLEPNQPQSKYPRDLRELQALCQGLSRDRTALMNRITTLHLAMAKRLVQTRLTLVNRQIPRLDAEIATRTRTCPTRARAAEILRSIPGIGETSAHAILAESPEIGTLNPQQSAALAGLAPITRQSIKCRGNACIQKGL